MDWLAEWQKAQNRLDLCCDEFHQHTVAEGCFVGDPKDITICILASKLQRMRDELRKLLEGIVQ